MPFIPLQCPNCGANLTVDSDKDAAICEFCGRPYIVKEAIIQTHINSLSTSINAENVNVYTQKDFNIGSSLSSNVWFTAEYDSTSSFKSLYSLDAIPSKL